MGHNHSKGEFTFVTKFLMSLSDENVSKVVGISDAASEKPGSIEYNTIYMIQLNEFYYL